MGIAERKEREKKQRRDEILQAAEKVFFSRGFDDCTMDDIADAAELSKGTLYLYFKSKEELHLEVAHNAVRLLNKKTSEAANQEGNSLEKLRQMGQACVEFSRSHPDHMKSILTFEDMEWGGISLTSTDIHDIIFIDSPVGTVIRVVNQGVDEKLIRSDMPVPLIAHTLWMSVLSVIRFVTMKSSLMEVLELSPQEVYQSYFELVINGIRK